MAKKKAAQADEAVQPEAEPPAAVGLLSTGLSAMVAGGGAASSTVRAASRQDARFSGMFFTGWNSDARASRGSSGR